MQNSMSKNKVKTFRINEVTQYKLTRLKNQWGISEGKTIERIIDSAYYKQFGDDPLIKEIIEIINTPWVEKY